MGKRIGFILASIHTGSALNMWAGLAREAERSGCAFFIFPGGRLDSHPDSEYLRNAIYSLANETNLDGLISWGSSIGGAVSIEELNHFHRTFENLPYVTIAHKMEGHPCVSFDAYTGMKSLVSHFITVHGAKKIAFLRGPETHASANDRYRAFCDAFIDAGMPPSENSPLVSSPFPWSAGEAAIIQLCEARKLVPGKDFDTLIGSSDMMAFSAVRYLKKLGFNIPHDFCVGGFNDSAESRILSPAFSTVHMPYKELGLMSFRIIREILTPSRTKRSGSSSVVHSSSDCILPTCVVIRESCGCRRVMKSDDQCLHSVSQVPLSADALKGELASILRLDETGVNAILDPILSAVLACDTELFVHLFELALERFFEDNHDSGLILDAIACVKSSGCLPIDYLSHLEKVAYRIIARVEARVYSFRQYETEKRYATLNSLKCDLLSSRDRYSLVSALACHLPEVGMHTAAVVLYENDEFSRYIGGFSPAGLDPEHDELFPARHLLPARVMRPYAEGVFMVQPLFMENRPLGYFICFTPFYDGLVFEELRSAISSALKGIFLFEESAQARQDAERADRAKTEFFANVGNELCDPLNDMVEKIVKLKNTVDTGPLEPAIISSQLQSLKLQVLSQLEQTNRLIDLTLAGIDGLTFENRLFRLEEVLSGVGPHPLLVGDPVRLSQAFDLVREEYPGPVTVSRSCKGIVVSFSSPSPRPKEIRRKPGMLLAERIAVLQYGDFIVTPSLCTIILTWPNLAGLPPLRGEPPEKIIRIPSVADREPELEEFGLPITESFDDEAPVLIAWNSDNAPLSDWMRVYALRHHPRLFRAPFLCFSQNLSGVSLIDLIEKNVRSESRGPILFVGSRVGSYPEWADDSNSVSIQSMTEFSASIGEVVPSLVVFEQLDLVSIEAVRRDSATVLVPIVVLPDRIESESDVTALSLIPRVILCNRGVASSPEFAGRIKKILAGDEILPPHTGALVKKTILYFNVHATTQIVRWKLADSVNVSEDYLTRIFHKETGFSLWEYLSRYRIFLATELLLRTNDSIYEIAQKTGFQDQAYFCRVFKKIHGFPPGSIRNRT